MPKVDIEKRWRIIRQLKAGCSVVSISNYENVNISMVITIKKCQLLGISVNDLDLAGRPSLFSIT